MNSKDQTLISRHNDILAWKSHFIVLHWRDFFVCKKIWGEKQNESYARANNKKYMVWDRVLPNLKFSNVLLMIIYAMLLKIHSLKIIFKIQCNWRADDLKLFFTDILHITQSQTFSELIELKIKYFKPSKNPIFEFNEIFIPLFYHISKNEKRKKIWWFYENKREKKIIKQMKMRIERTNVMHFLIKKSTHGLYSCESQVVIVWYQNEGINEWHVSKWRHFNKCKQKWVRWLTETKSRWFNETAIFWSFVWIVELE